MFEQLQGKLVMLFTAGKKSPAKTVHDCEEVHRYQVHFNLAVVRFGVVWQCPDCRAFWYRCIEYIDGLSRLGRYRGVSTWQRMTKSEVRKLQRLVQQDLSQYEIAERMKFATPSCAGSYYPEYWRDDIERNNQEPRTWVFV